MWGQKPRELLVHSREDFPRRARSGGCLDGPKFGPRGLWQAKRIASARRVASGRVEVGKARGRFGPKGDGGFRGVSRSYLDHQNDI